MDIIDVLITIVIIVIVVGGEALKVKKKIASVSEKQARKEVESEDEYDLRQTVSYKKKEKLENEKFGDNSSKTSPYFTYEDVSDNENFDLAADRPRPSQTQEIHLQEVENETERTEINLNDPEELKKAIIYGEILKNPYN